MPLLKDGSKSGRIEMRESWRSFAAWQPSNYTSVYHGEHGDAHLRKELGRSYVTITTDLVRVMSRIKALYRKLGPLPAAVRSVYTHRGIAQNGWIRIPEPGVRLRAERFVSATGSAAAGASASATRLADRPETCKHPARENCFAARFLRSVRFVRPCWLAQLQTPHRFRTKRQLWRNLQWFRAGDPRQRQSTAMSGGKLQRNRGAHDPCAV